MPRVIPAQIEQEKEAVMLIRLLPKYPKAGAAVDDWATPSFRREYMTHMDWIVGWNGITRRHTARAIRQRARYHRRRLGDKSTRMARMGTKALRRGIAKLRASRVTDIAHKGASR